MSNSLSKRAKVAGWISLFLAISAIPTMVLMALSQSTNNYSLITGLSVLDIISIPLIIFPLLTLKEILNKKLDFHKIDSLVPLLIVLTVLQTIFNVLKGQLGVIGQSDLVSLGIQLLVTILFAIPSLIFHIRILPVASKLPGLTFSNYAGLVTVSLLLSVILTPLAVLALPVAYFADAIFFFKNAKVK